MIKSIWQGFPTGATAPVMITFRPYITQFTVPSYLLLVIRQFPHGENTVKTQSKSKTQRNTAKVHASMRKRF